MRETVLLYNFNDEKLPKIRRALLPLKLFIKTVPKEDFLQPIGFLAGIKDIQPTEEKFTESGFCDEMLLMCGFTSAKTDMLIKALRRAGVGRIELKAVITPTNKYWNSIELYNAIKEEHRQMQENNML